MRNLIVILICFMSWGLNSQNQMSLFKQANDYYNEGEYLSAIELYHEILETEEHSSELYFNLGNAYYKTNQVAPSIFYYEKALQLNPDDKDITNNLAFAQNMTIDAIEQVPDVGLSKVIKTNIGKLNFDSWAILSVSMMILFVSLFLLYYFSYNTVKKRFYFLAGFSCLFLCLLTLSFAFQAYEWKMNENPAIVFAEESDVKTDPNLRSDTVFKIHEGTKVEVVEEYDDQWWKIELADGKSGWIPSEDLKLLSTF